MGFVDGDLYLLDARFRQTPIGQPLGQRLDEPHRRAAGQPHQPVRDGAIVDGKGQIVVSRCCPGIQPQNGVDDEFLAIALLVLPHTVPAEHAHPLQGDPVQAHPPSPVGPAPSALPAAPAPPAPPVPAAPALPAAPDLPAGPDLPAAPDLAADGAPASAPAPAAALAPVADSACPAASRQASATRTASAFAGTSWTRAHHAPAVAARAVTATVASSQPANGRGEPSGPASSRPRNRLREAQTRTGKMGPPPRLAIWPRWVSSAQLCSASLANPRPGSRMISPGSTPSATTASTRRRSSSHTSPTTSSYTARSCIWWLCPRPCITT